MTRAEMCVGELNFCLYPFKFTASKVFSEQRQVFLDWKEQFSAFLDQKE